MRVEKVLTQDNKIRYIVVDKDGLPVIPVAKYLKFKDSYGISRNSLRAYAYHLKLFFEFLESKGLNYENVTIDNMADFLIWLQSPYKTDNVIPFKQKPIESKRSPRTINIIISTVLDFYDYLMRNENYSGNLSERLKKEMSGSRRGYKGFLYHIQKEKSFLAKILKIKEPKTRPKVLTKEQVKTLINACNNLRDKFLISLLWETGIRIGEALSLWIEDFSIDKRILTIKDRGELENKAEIKTVNSPRTIHISEKLTNMFIQYVADYHTNEVDTNFVFIKLSGKNKYQPMEYQDVDSLFKRLYKKTGIKATPHMLRHTSLTELRKAGLKPEHLQKRAGHKDVQFTIQTYYHPTDEDIRKDWEKSFLKVEKIYE